ncbi:DedA family protein [Patescibacteria group bacterium]|nr:DedA family protein [Patescibacteria group bacterium]
MINAIIAPLAKFIITLISNLGYFGIAIAMAIESASIPLPSEIIMPFSGFLVSTGELNFWLVVLAASVGGVAGSAAAYAVGYYGGETVVRTVIRKYGKFVLVHEYELDEAEEWFRHHGKAITFFSRLLPVIRTFISLPAGIAKMNFKTFLLYAFLGTIIWCTALTYFGLILGQNWNTLGPWFHKFDAAIGIVSVAGGAWYIRYKIRKIQQYNQAHNHSRTDKNKSR